MGSVSQIAVYDTQNSLCIESVTQNETAAGWRKDVGSLYNPNEQWEATALALVVFDVVQGSIPCPSLQSLKEGER